MLCKGPTRDTAAVCSHRGTSEWATVNATPGDFGYHPRGYCERRIWPNLALLRGRRDDHDSGPSRPVLIQTGYEVGRLDPYSFTKQSQSMMGGDACFSTTSIRRQELTAHRRMLGRRQGEADGNHLVWCLLWASWMHSLASGRDFCKPPAHAIPTGSSILESAGLQGKRCQCRTFGACRSMPQNLNSDRSPSACMPRGRGRALSDKTLYASTNIPRLLVQEDHLASAGRLLGTTPRRAIGARSRK